MVFRKPIAFLIKHFKKINLLVTAMLIYVAFKTTTMLSYINGYIDGKFGKLLALEYVSYAIYILIILSIIAFIIMYLLMKYKEKSKTIYIILILAYVLIFILAIFSNYCLVSLSNNALSEKNIRLARDLIFYGNVLQYISIVIVLIKTFGFDVKTFDFDESKTLDISNTDNEEIEVNLGIDTRKYTTKARRSLRELRYYYIENKPLILIIMGIISFIIVISIILNINFFNKVYKENEVFKGNGISLKITNSYIASRDYMGNDISYNNSSYVILKIEVTAFKEGNYKLDIDDFALSIKGKTFLPYKKYYQYFTDLGVGYNTQYITNESINKYILVYNVDNAYIYRSMKLRYEVENKNRLVKLDPTNLDELQKTSTLKLLDTIDFNNTVIGNITLKINSYEINNSFKYDYSYIIKEETITTKGIVNADVSKILLNLEMDTNFNDINLTNNDLISYSTIHYIVDKKEYTVKNITNKTPSSYKTGVMLEIDENIKDASSIWLEFTVRNIKYKYVIK